MATVATPTDKTTEKVEKKSPPVPDEKPDRKQRPRVDEKFKIFSGTANQPLADEVCHFLGMQRGQAQVIRFADGECYVQIQENVRGADVFVMQPTCRRECRASTRTFAGCRARARRCPASGRIRLVSSSLMRT